MRLVSRTFPASAFRSAAIAAGAAALTVAAFGTASLFAGDDDEDAAAASAEAKKAAQAALDKAVGRGKDMWSSKDRFGKACSTCHEKADKPQLNLATREFSYPAYSRRKRAVVTLQQKVQEMIQFNSKGTPLDDKGTEIADLEAYVMSLKTKK